MSIRVLLLASLAFAVACGGDDEADGNAGGAGGAGRDDGGAGGAGRGAGAGTGGRGSNGAGTAGAAGRAGTDGADPGDDAGADSGQGGAQGGDDAGADASGSGGAGGSEAPPIEGAVCTSDGACEQEVELEPAAHMEGDIDYGDLPPAGGPHNGCWGDYGIHADAFAPENWVHNLEHGAVVVLYDCPDGCGEEVTQLEGFVDARSWGILAGYEDMDTRFALVAWGYRLMTDELDLEAFADFYDAHANQAPESVSSGKPGGCP